MDSKLKYLKANKLRSMVVWENLAEDKKQYNMDGYAQIPDTNAVNLTHTQLFTGEHRQHIITIDLVTWQLDQTKLRESIKKNDIVYSQIARSHQRPKKSSNKYK
jgi:hypothetical protein